MKFTAALFYPNDYCNPPTVCHSELVEVFSSEERGKTEEQRDEGISERVWLACFHKCNIPLTSHRDFKRDPASPKGSRFCIAIRSAEVRQAQDDRQMCYSVVIVSYKKIKGFFLGL